MSTPDAVAVVPAPHELTEKNGRRKQSATHANGVARDARARRLGRCSTMVSMSRTLAVARPPSRRGFPDCAPLVHLAAMAPVPRADIIGAWHGGTHGDS